MAAARRLVIWLALLLMLLVTAPARGFLLHTCAIVPTPVPAALAAASHWHGSSLTGSVAQQQGRARSTQRAAAGGGNGMYMGLNLPPLPPRPLGHVMPHSDTSATPNVLVELYLDLACPYAGRLYGTIQGVLPQYAGKGVQWKMYQVVQPWHPQSTYMHEAVLAVKAVKPEAFFDYCGAVWKAREEKFIDDVTIDKTRSEIYDILSDIAESVGVDRAAVRDELKLKAAGNMGTFMTQQIKWATQYHRKRGVHVTPTVFVNGIEVGAISSSATEEQWKELLETVLSS